MFPYPMARHWVANLSWPGCGLYSFIVNFRFCQVSKPWANRLFDAAIAAHWQLVPVVMQAVTCHSLGGMLWYTFCIKLLGSVSNSADSAASRTMALDQSQIYPYINNCTWFQPEVSSWTVDSHNCFVQLGAGAEAGKWLWDARLLGNWISCKSESVVLSQVTV